MEARFESIVSPIHRSFRCRQLVLPRFDAPWHFHPEIELTLITASTGCRYVGDSIEPFEAGDLVLLGPNLPHCWQNPGIAAEGQAARAIVVHFRAEALGEILLRAPEGDATRRLLARARRGLKFGSTRSSVAEALARLPDKRGMAALGALIEILGDLSRTSVRELTTSAYAPRLGRRGERRMRRVCQHLQRRYREPVTLNELARVGAMAPAAFSRYFKQTAGRNVSEFLLEMRIAHAANALIETDARIADIALDAGFATLSNFNRQFLRTRGMTPSEFRRTFLSLDVL